MEWNKVMNFGDPSTFGTEMADRFVASGANLPPPVSNRVKYKFLLTNQTCDLLHVIGYPCC